MIRLRIPWFFPQLSVLPLLKRGGRGAQTALCFLACMAVTGSCRSGETVPPRPEPCSLAPDDPSREALHLRNIRRLTFAGSKNGEAYFSPDGKRIVFQAVREPALNNPFYQIYTMDLENGACRRISSGK